MIENIRENKFTIVEKFFLRSDSILEEQVVPLYDMSAIGGLTSLFVDDHIPIEEIRVPNMPKCDGAIHVKGESMDPPIREGDIILYKLTQSRRGGLFFGEVYLLDFIIDGDTYVAVKRVFESEIPGHYRLESNNPGHPPRDIPRDSVRGMAIVKMCIRYGSL